MLRVKRVYTSPEDTDGIRVLVDRLWPRGLSKEAARLDAWLREVAPSPELRKWFNHEPGKFAEFALRYEAELTREPAAGELARIRQWLEEGSPVTLLYAAKDERHNHAVVLQEALTRWRTGAGSEGRDSPPFKVGPCI
ncbi:DUF488 domain-containing protein [Paenibacillus sanguinis]|uniref:DUF488 domain-containing protein n=1 Tax=Paenibacillus sanguinis TaxID=225906 RepID=UPI00036BA1F7|nr:DUF488 domain-containing protein [Paenibacillus sanguinis]